jgi:hypothetical protein
MDLFNTLPSHTPHFSGLVHLKLVRARCLCTYRGQTLHVFSSLTFELRDAADLDRVLKTHHRTLTDVKILPDLWRLVQRTYRTPSLSLSTFGLLRSVLQPAVCPVRCDLDLGRVLCSEIDLLALSIHICAEMVSPALAQELVDRVVDFSHNDPPSLRACALAHSRLRASSQVHLFEKVTVKTSSSTARLSVVFQCTPALARYVCELHLHDQDLLAVHEALGPLPRLRTLRLDLRITSTAPSTWPGWPVLHSFSSATRLVLGLVELADMRQFAELVNALPALTELAFGVRVRVGSLELRGVDPPTQDLRLVHLDLRGVADRQLLDTLAKWMCVEGRPTLASLEILYISMYFVPPALLLQSAASSLQHLLVRHHVGEPSEHLR